MVSSLLGYPKSILTYCFIISIHRSCVASSSFEGFSNFANENSATLDTSTDASLNDDIYLVMWWD